jgi:hypothetical protein
MEVAALFHAAGCGAEVEKLVEGARGKHKVDVYVTFDKYGIKCSWIVECKFWNSNVPKEKVMALGAILADVGADRGLIISRKGFQSGAIRAAQRTNITLTSLEDLQLYISDKAEELEQLHQRLAELEDQRDASQEQLGEYRCPDCGSDLVTRVPIWYDERNEGLVETFGCGYETGGHNDRPCPFGPDFPSLDEYDLTMFNEESEPHWKYQCFAAPKTKKAKRVRLDIGHGETPDEARDAVIEHYRYLTTPPGQEFRGKLRSRSGYPKPIE